jgi:hypothetical protein
VDVVDRVRQLDLTLFAHVASQATDDDRRSLLALQAAIATRRETYVWLEIGSYLGGSLQPLVVDSRCSRIISIDPRPQIVPDDRDELGRYDYGIENTTAAMLAGLSSIPNADVTKIESIERSTAHINISDIERPDICFVDGEHTRAAVLQDARFCRQVVQDRGVIVFHDFRIIRPGIADFLRETPGPVTAYLLSDSVFVIELGSTRSILFEDPLVARQIKKWPVLWRWASRLRLSGEMVMIHDWLYRTALPALRRLGRT